MFGTKEVSHRDYSIITSLDPALPGSIMRREGSNISRCKPFFGVQLLKQGLHLEIFDMFLVIFAIEFSVENFIIQFLYYKIYIYMNFHSIYINFTPVILKLIKYI